MTVLMKQYTSKLLSHIIKKHKIDKATYDALPSYNTKKIAIDEHLRYELDNMKDYAGNKIELGDLAVYIGTERRIRFGVVTRVCKDKGIQLKSRQFYSYSFTPDNLIVLNKPLSIDFINQVKDFVNE